MVLSPNAWMSFVSIISRLRAAVRWRMTVISVSHSSKLSFLVDWSATIVDRSFVQSRKRAPDRRAHGTSKLYVQRFAVFRRFAASFSVEWWRDRILHLFFPVKTQDPFVRSNFNKCSKLKKK